MRKDQRKDLHAKIDGLAHRQHLRDQARAFQKKHFMLLRAIRQRKVSSISDGVEICKSIRARSKVTEGNYGTKQLHVDSGDVLVFAPDGTYMCITPDFVSANFWD